MPRFILLIVLLFSCFIGFGQCPNIPPNHFLIFTSQAEIDNFAQIFPDCTQFPYSVQIKGEDIIDVSPLSQIISIDGFFSIAENPNLIILDGLENIVRLSSLNIRDNPSLINFTPSFIGTLESITSSASIINNNQLVNFEGLFNNTYVSSLFIVKNDNLLSFVGLENITLSDLTVNENSSLISFDGLQNIFDLDFLDIRDNNSLMTLDGLNNVLGIVIVITIMDNPNLLDISALSNIQIGKSVDLIGNTSLSNCSIDSICNAISDNNILVTIENNNANCNTLVEDEELCLLKVSDFDSSDQILTYPNPVSDNLTIELDSGIGDAQITLSTINSQIIQEDISNTLDMSRMSAGMYFLRVNTGARSIV